MEWLPLLYQILEVCVIPLLGVLTAYLVKYIKIKSAEIQATVDNDTADKYIALLSDTITACVIATNQTYVESLKLQGKFDMEAQKEAFRKSADAVMLILNEDAKEYLSTVVGDLDIYITKKIEASVNENKK